MISYENIKDNFLRYKNKKVYAVLKANSYCHGIKEVATSLMNICDNYAVIDINEAITIRNISKKCNILLLGDYKIENIDDYIKYNISISISSISKLLLVINEKLDIQLKIDCGFNRLGVKIEELKQVMNLLKYSKLNLKGIYSHIPFKFNNKKKYMYYYNLLKKELSSVKGLDLHVASSYGFINDNFFNSIRIGIGLYNYLPSLIIKSNIIKTFNIKSFESFGYDKKYINFINKRIGLIDLGYYNGILNCYKNYYVVINNKKYKVLKYICMNYTYILIDKKVKVNDIVEVIGYKNKLKNISRKLKISEHEILLNFLKK